MRIPEQWEKRRAAYLREVGRPADRDQNLTDEELRLKELTRQYKNSAAYARGRKRRKEQKRQAAVAEALKRQRERGPLPPAVIERRSKPRDQNERANWDAAR